MSQRYVTLGDGRMIGLGAYVAAWRTVLAADPATRFRGGSLTGWKEESPCAADIVRQFRDGLAARINRHIPGYGHGRKWDSDWFWNARRTADAVNTPRLIVRPPTVPLEFRARLAARLAWDC